MGEQHAEGDFVAALVSDRKLGQRADHVGVDIQLFALMQQHCHRRGGDDLGERGDIKDAFGFDGAGFLFVSIMTEALIPDERTFASYGH